MGYGAPIYIYTPFISRWNSPLILTIDPNFRPIGHPSNHLRWIFMGRGPDPPPPTFFPEFGRPYAAGIMKGQWWFIEDFLMNLQSGLFKNTPPWNTNKLIPPKWWAFEKVTLFKDDHIKLMVRNNQSFFLPWPWLSAKTHYCTEQSVDDQCWGNPPSNVHDYGRKSRKD